MSRRAGIVAILLAAAVLAMLWMRPDKPVAIAPSESLDSAGEPGTAAARMNPVDEEEAVESLFQAAENLVRGLPIPGCEDAVAQRQRDALQFDAGTVAREAVKGLRGSDDAQLVLAAAFMTDDHADATRLLERVLALDPRNRVALWQRLVDCDSADRGCSRTALETALLSADESNGMIWLEIASERLRQENWKEAEAALQRAASAPRFDAYFVDQAMTIERGLAAASSLDYAKRMVYGIGVAAASAYPSYYDVTRACGREESSSPINAETCRQLGQRMAEHSNTVFSTSIGYSIWSNAATRQGDVEKAEELDDKKQALSNVMIRALADTGAMVLLENDVAILQEYIDNLIVHGQIRAAQMQIQTAIRLRSDPTYDQCNFVGDPTFRVDP